MARKKTIKQSNCWQIVTKIAWDLRKIIIFGQSRFPAISTGAYGYPKNEAAESPLKTVKISALRILPF
jgi:hypothetical protein